MPQGKRKVPFSGKKKKEQILEKRKSRDSKHVLKKPQDDSDEEDGDNIQKLNIPTSSRGRGDTTRFVLQFHKESKKELLLMKQEARTAFVQIPPKEREIDMKYFDGYDFPLRPEWNYNTSKEELDRIENRYFTEYVQNLEKMHASENKILSLFELNIETWRQLWRVLEMSDVILIIVDVRFPALMFPPSLYYHITEKLKKSVIIILNKVDLVPFELAIAWKYYFLDKYPEISVVLFSNYRLKTTQNMKIQKGLAKTRLAAGVLEIYKSCLKIVGKDLDLSKWEQKILEEMEDTDDSSNSKIQNYISSLEKKEMDFKFEEHVKYKDGILTIGCVGFPNAGKSSLINALKGRKVVSVSRTPGHTKHFQTIFITENVKICDCPGLVFPSSTPKYLQVLVGSYPVAQLREPYCSIKYLGERVDLIKILDIKMPPDFTQWSTESVCEAWALKRGFLTAKAGRPDHYRAANNLLRMALEGKIILEFYPPKYLESYDDWKNHPDVKDLMKFLDLEKMEQKRLEAHNISSSEIDSDGSRQEETDTNYSSTSDLISENVFELLQEEDIQNS